MTNDMDNLDLVPDSGRIYVVGALVTDSAGRVYAHRRSLECKLFPGCWDVIGGHVESGETLREALVREVREETGWELRDVVRCLKEFEWSADGVVRYETDYLVTVAGDLTNPRLEDGKQDKFAWFTRETLGTLLENREEGDRAIYDMVEAALNAVGK